MKKVLANIICWFVPGSKRRRIIRMRFNNPIRKWTKFAMGFSNKRHPRIKYLYGYRCINFIVNVDDKFVFKFPIRGDGWEYARRELRVTDALRGVSPIKIPHMEIIDLDGIAVRKYECVRGVGLRALDEDTQNAHADKIAKQLAKFLYAVGTADPVAIRDLKTHRTDKPSIMHGWNQGDLWDNFIMNPKTFDVVGVIDWEGAVFGDFYDCFTHGTHNNLIKNALLREYLKLHKK